MSITFTLSLSLLAFLLTTTATAINLPSVDCTNEIVTFSPCLPYTSLPPNDLTHSVSRECCETFSATLAAGNGSCYCLLLTEPPIIGFPLNYTRILSLSSVCSPSSPLENASPFRNFTLQYYCAALEASPPVVSPVQESRNKPDNKKLAPRSVGNLPSFHSNDFKPRTEDDSILAPSPPRRFHFNSSQVSSATSIVKLWSSIVPLSSLCLIV